MTLAGPRRFGDAARWLRTTADTMKSRSTQSSGFLDLEFIVLIVLSLFAILFTYDAISGEKERGTLRLSFAGPVARHTYMTGKLLGSFLGAWGAASHSAPAGFPDVANHGCANDR